MADSNSCFSSSAIVLAATIYLVLVSNPFQTHAMAATNAISGFSADLIHRDSPLSPFYNPSETPSDRLRNAFRRSTARTNNRYMTKTMSRTIIYSGGEYFMNISIGTPPVVIPLSIDTGSDLIWTQCVPCTTCFTQLSPLFDPKQSSAYIKLPCESLPCKALGYGHNFCTPQNLCAYNYSYVDGSLTNGFLAADTFTIGSVSLPDSFFGCAHNNRGTFDEQGSGVMGLGRGPLSLVSQFTSSMGRRFSYCLAPVALYSFSTGKIYFGDEAVVSGESVVSTPFVANGADISYYYVALEAVSVGQKRMSTNYYDHGGAKNYGRNGNNIPIVIDSGTTCTYLPRKFYDDIEAAMDNAIRGKKRVDEPHGILKLCYESESVGDIDAPIVTFHFGGNASVDLNTLNTFIRVGEDVVCLSILPTDGVAIYGNKAQMNFLVGFDIESQTVSFKPRDCTM